MKSVVITETTIMMSTPPAPVDMPDCKTKTSIIEGFGNLNGYPRDEQLGY